MEDGSYMYIHMCIFIYAYIYVEREGPIRFNPESSLYVIVPSPYAPVYVDILLYLYVKKLIKYMNNI
jgi:hypothetical protein